MKKGNNTSFFAAILVIACWSCLSTIRITPSQAQEDGLKYTLYGDEGADLNGVVSDVDFTILVGNLGGSVSTWDQGDFNYDGVVDGIDFTTLVGNLGSNDNGSPLGLPGADMAAIDAFAAANGLQADVPEPASLSLLALGSLGILSRRRSRA